MTKKLKLTIITLLSVQIANAQLYIGANAGINNTKLYNSSDAKADERQDYVLTLKPQIGIEIGYRLNSKLSIGLQPQIFQAGQKYKGNYVNLFRLDNAYSDLNYLKIPVYVQYSINPSNRVIGKFIRLGLYYSNLFSANSFTKYKNETPIQSNDYLGTLESIVNGTNVISYNNYFPPNQPSYADTFLGKSSSSAFSKNDYGINLSMGYTFSLSNRMVLQLSATSSFGVSNVENINSITLTDLTSGLVVDSFTSSQSLHSKYNLFPRADDKKRSIFTNNRAIGIQVGITYLLGNKESLQPKKF
jgi:hypothetical protein